jgi:uncharacterized protein YifE (UPF0438 family)
VLESVKRKLGGGQVGGHNEENERMLKVAVSRELRLGMRFEERAWIQYTACSPRMMRVFSTGSRTAVSGPNIKFTEK